MPGADPRRPPLILDKAPTKSVASHIKSCISGFVNAGLDEGHLLARQDLLRGLRWRGIDNDRDEPADHAVTWEEIPTVDALHALALRTAERTGHWWRELQLLLVAYSGLRWGEHSALVAEQFDLERRRLSVNRQNIDSRHGLVPSLPKGRRRRITMFPEVTPARFPLAETLQRRLAEVELAEPLFPAARGGWQRRSNYGRYIWDRAAVDVAWPRRDDGRWLWPFHSLRHVFATWALHDARTPIEDLSRLMGHSSTRVTQDIYIHVRHDMFDRIYTPPATGNPTISRDGHKDRLGARTCRREAAPRTGTAAPADVPTRTEAVAQHQCHRRCPVLNRHVSGVLVAASTT